MQKGAGIRQRLPKRKGYAFYILMNRRPTLRAASPPQSRSAVAPPSGMLVVPPGFINVQPVI
jgi:hypothetical protein